MAKIFYRRKALLAKVETTYGTDATPTASTDSVLTSNFELTPWEGQRLERNLDKGTFGSDLSTQLAKHGILRFRVEAAGSGAATQAPAYGGIMRAAGHSETIETVAGSDPEDRVIYAPIDTGVPSLTCYFHHDTKLHKFLGTRGSVTFSDAKRAYPYLQFEFRGLYVPVADGVMPTPDNSGYQKPVPFRASEVITTLFAQTVGMHSFTLTGGQSVDFYEHSEEESIQQMDRNATYQMSFEEPNATTHDFWADADGETTGAINILHGTTAGNIVEIEVDNAQLFINGIADENGVRALNVSGPCVPVAGAPDYRYITK